MDQKKGWPIAIGGLVLAAIAGTAAFIKDTETIQNFWCAHLGSYCSFPVETSFITVSSGGGKGDACGTKQVSACITPSSEKRVLIEGTRFAVEEHSAGVFIDGKPVNNDPIGTSNIGWLPPKETPESACIVVYARTSACETVVSIKGKVKGTEVYK